jgi:hypothetical protein
LNLAKRDMKKALTFKTEKEEADYWHRNRRQVEADLRQVAKSGKSLTVAEIVAGEGERMIELTNSFHKTRATVRATVGDTVSLESYNRVRRQLCGNRKCECGKGPDGTRDSRYSLVLTRRGHGPERGLVVDNQASA